jgi:mono/diheme cytochrome c family protein
MRPIVTCLSLTTLVACLIVVAKGTVRRVEPSSRSERSAAQIYGRLCVSCHGQDGRAQTNKGKFNHARDLSDPKWQDDASDERIFNSIWNGRNVQGTMPPFSTKVTEKEADSLVTYVRGLRK